MKSISAPTEMLFSFQDLESNESCAIRGVAAAGSMTAFSGSRRREGKKTGDPEGPLQGGAPQFPLTSLKPMPWSRHEEVFY